jgi:hypothetical protein
MLSTVGWVIAGAGGATLVTGAVLLLTGDDPHKYDEKPADQKLARWRVLPRVGPGVAFVAVDGWF